MSSCLNRHTVFGRLSFALVLVVCAMAAQLRAADRDVHIAIEDLPATFANPYRAARQAPAAIFDPLTAFDVDGRLRSALATSWEAVDAVTWRMRLRPGVAFSNGAPFTATAVVKAVAHLATVAGQDEIVKREVPFLKFATAVDDLTVDIVTTEPVPLFPRYAAAILIPEPGTWTALGPEAFARSPVGTGPFIADAIDRTHWLLSAAATSWRPAKVAGLEILMVPDTSARVQALASGRVDVAMVIGPDNRDAIETVGGRVLVGINPAVYGFTLIATRDGALADRRVRMALNMAVDRKTLIDQLLGGTTVAANQPAVRTAFGYDPAIPDYPFDRAAARSLLADAGYPDGFSFQLDAPVGASASDTAVFQKIQGDLRTIGVTMTVRTMPNTLYLTKVNKTEFDGDAFPIAWPAWPALDVWRALQVHSCLRPVPWYCDQSIMPKMTAARSEWREETALALRREIGRHYHDDAPALFLYELPQVVGLGPRIKALGIANSVIEFHNIELHP